jgi:hypothetical protein
MDDWSDPADLGAADGDGEDSLSGAAGEAGVGDTARPLHDHLWVFDGDTAWDLGPAELDADADGLNDSLTRGTVEQFTVYTDTDADGRVDRITELDESGACSVSDLDPDTGMWRATRLGRLD